MRFYYRMRRVDCRHCGRIITEAIPWASGKHRLTNDFRIFLAQWSRLLSWKDCAKMFHAKWDNVFRSVQWVVQYGLAHRLLKKSRYCFLKRATNLTDHQKIRLKDLLSYNLKTVRAYQIK